MKTSYGPEQVDQEMSARHTRHAENMKQLAAIHAKGSSHTFHEGKGQADFEPEPSETAGAPCR